MCIRDRKYPVHTYGYLTGEVASIAYVPYSKNYAVEINFPYGPVSYTHLDVYKRQR